MKIQNRAAYLEVHNKVQLLSLLIFLIFFYSLVFAFHKKHLIGDHFNYKNNKYDISPVQALGRQL